MDQIHQDVRRNHLEANMRQKKSGWEKKEQKDGEEALSIGLF